MAICTSLGTHFTMQLYLFLCLCLCRVGSQLYYCKVTDSGWALHQKQCWHIFYKISRWHFGVIFHQLGRAESVISRWFWLLAGSVTSKSLKRNSCKVESSSFSLFSNLYTGLCFGLTIDRKPPERLGSAKKLDMVYECHMNQWKAHLYLLFFQVKSWKEVESSTGFPSGNGVKSRSCNPVHQRWLLF